MFYFTHKKTQIFWQFVNLQFIDFSSISFHTIILIFIFISWKTNDNINTIMSVIDKFIKRITMLTEIIIFILEQWAFALLNRFNIVDWNYSKILISNRNKKFLSNFWKIIFSRLSINLLYLILYHLQTNNLSERTNRTAEIVFQFYIHDLEKLTLWFKTLSQFQIFMNNSRSFSIFKTSNEVFYEFISNKSFDLLRQDNVIFRTNSFKTK